MRTKLLRKITATYLRKNKIKTHFHYHRCAWRDVIRPLKKISLAFSFVRNVSLYARSFLPYDSPENNNIKLFFGVA